MGSGKSGGRGLVRNVGNDKGKETIEHLIEGCKEVNNRDEGRKEGLLTR